MDNSTITIGGCRITPALNTIERDGRVVVVQPRAMELLVFLAARPGQVVSTHELIAEVWHGRLVVDHAVYRLIKQLRDALGDDVHAPRFIRNIRKRGYMLIAPVDLDAGNDEPNLKQRLTPTRSRVRPRATVIAAVLALIAGLIGMQFVGPQTGREPIASIQVLITEVDHLTSDEPLAAALAESLQREIDDSPRFEIASSRQIRETLALMRQPSASLTPEIGREIASRSDSAMLVLESRVRSIGSITRARAALIDPHEAAVLATEELVLDDTIAPDAQFARFAERLRAAAESVDTDIAFEPLERVTTTSLDALEMYSEGLALSLRRSTSLRNQRIISLTRAALEIDPQFASAEILLAHFLRNTGFSPETFIAHAETALGNADGTTTEETLFIRGSYASLLGNFAEAIDHYEALLALNPEHYWAINNLAHHHANLGDTQRAAQYLAARSDLLPTRAELAADAATLLNDIDQPNIAEEYWRRARSQSASPATTPSEQSLVAVKYVQSLMQRADELWAQGEYRLLLDELRRLEGGFERLAIDERGNLAIAIAGTYLNLGRTRDAESILSRYHDPARFFDAPLIEAATGQPWPVSEGWAITGQPDDTTLFDRKVVWALARRGELEEIESILLEVRNERAALEADDTRDLFGFRQIAILNSALVESELLRAAGDDSGADELTGTTLKELVAIRPRDVFAAALAYLSAEPLASRLAARGEIDAAIAVLEDWGGGQARSEVPPGNVIFWMRNRLALGELLADRDPTRANELRSGLAAMLEFADEDHYVAEMLRAL